MTTDLSDKFFLSDNRPVTLILARMRVTGRLSDKKNLSDKSVVIQIAYI